MQYLEMTSDMTLSKLASIVGERNVDSVLNTNGLERGVNINKEFKKKINDLDNYTSVTKEQKLNILNQFVGDLDLYEKIALGTEDDWKALTQYNCFTDAIRIPVEIKLPSSIGVLGNSEPVPDVIYAQCTDYIQKGERIDPSVFTQYNAIVAVGSSSVLHPKTYSPSSNPFEWMKLPWGEIALYSSVSTDLLYFPVYPEGFDDGVNANYDEMGEMLYQYEPWKVYKSSGPRENTFTFKFHRDMWNGDHRDGCANDLIRGCEANCYPQYDGSLVNAPIVTLYIHGENYITGIMTNCKVHWDGPIGLDGFYLMCELSFTIVEVSPQALNYDTIRSKGLIG